MAYHIAYLITLKTLLMGLYCNVSKFGLLLITLYCIYCSFLSTVTAVNTEVELLCSILSLFVSEWLAL